MLKKINTYTWRLSTLLGNLKLSIMLLLVLSLFSSLGTIIEQDKLIPFYELNYPNSNPLFGFINSNIILFFGLNHVYTTWWFDSTVFLFGLSLISCTFNRQLPSLKMARLWQFYNKSLNLTKFKLNFQLKNVSLSKVAFNLKDANYAVIQQGPFLYAYRGLLGKISPIVVHASMIIILTGSVLGIFSGYMVQELVPSKELFHLQNIITSGALSYIPQNFEGYVQDFKIAYDEEGSIDQFYSDLSILDNNGDTLTSKTIYVNEPLRYNGITFYQTDWSIFSINLELDKRKTIQIPFQLITTSDNTRFWIAKLPFISSNGKKDDLLLILQDLTGKILMYNSEKELVGETSLGHKIFLNGHSLRVTSIIPSTGLQIKSDPGIIFVYVGFLFLMLSVVTSYTSYSQIWALKKSNDLYISGQTNRAIYYFEKQLIELINMSKTNN
jgi:cytochrome c biogenesis protein